MRTRLMAIVVLLAACSGGDAADNPDARDFTATQNYAAPEAAGAVDAEPGEMLSRDLIEKWRHATEVAWTKAGGDATRVFTADGGMNSTPQPLDVLQIGRESGIDLTIFSNVNRMIYSFVIAPRFVGDAATEDISEEVREHNDRFIAENREWIMGQLAKLGYTGDVRS